MHYMYGSDDIIRLNQLIQKCLYPYKAKYQSLIVDIYESLAKNEYDRCLELIENYLTLSGLRNPEILSIKAYILVSLNTSSH